MKYYLNYENQNLIDYVLKSPDIVTILKDNEFKKYILEEKNHYPFVWLVEKLKDKPYLSNLFLTPQFLDEIINDHRASDKVNAIISSNPNVLENASDKVIEFLLNNKSLFFIYDNLNLVVANKMLEYILHKDNSKIGVLSNLSSTVQMGIFNADNIEDILKLSQLEECYRNFCPAVIIKLFQYPKYRNLIYNLPPWALVELSSKFKNYEIPIWVQNNNELINTIVSIESPGYYRDIINNFIEKNYDLVTNLESKRKEYVNNLLSTINKSDIFEEYIQLRNYVNKNGIDEKIMTRLPSYLCVSDFSDDTLRKMTFIRLFENICDLYFKDYAKNVLIDIREVMNFLKVSNLDLVPAERQNIYNTILSFDTLQLDDIKHLYKALSNYDNWVELLYNDVRNCKNRSYDMFNENFFKINENYNLRNNELSNATGCDVYVLDGEDFVACVHVGWFSDKSPRKTISLSVVGTENIGMFYKEDVILGFEYLKPDNIINMHNYDSYSGRINYTDRINKIFTPHGLLKQTNKYNEVLYSEKNDNVLLPSYVVCKDQLDEQSIDYARMHGLPMVIINTKKYLVNNSDDYGNCYQKYEDDSFVINYFERKK